MTRPFAGRQIRGRAWAFTRRSVGIFYFFFRRFATSRACTRNSVGRTRRRGRGREEATNASSGSFTRATGSRSSGSAKANFQAPPTASGFGQTQSIRLSS